jgi:protein-tyrosine phosphatase
VTPPSLFLKGLRGAPDRLLHPLRRRRALAALRTRPTPVAVLVVCHGNICRSPFAAALLRRSLSQNAVWVDSAGFIGPGRPSPAEAVAAAAHYRVDLSTHRSDLLTADRAHAADLIVVMDAAQRREICDRFGRTVRDVLVLGDLDPQAIDTRTIRDPVNQPRAVFEEAYARIERCVRALERAIGQLGAAAPRRRSEHPRAADDLRGGP